MTMNEVKNELFAKVLERAKTQVRSTDPSKSMCRYRANYIANDMSPTNVCFAGCLIAPEFYNTEMEGKGVQDRELQAVVIKSNPNMHQLTLQEQVEVMEWIRSIQKVHDTCEPENWMYQLSMRAPAIF